MQEKPMEPERPTEAPGEKMPPATGLQRLPGAPQKPRLILAVGAIVNLNGVPMRVKSYGARACVLEAPAGVRILPGRIVRDEERKPA